MSRFLPVALAVLAVGAVLLEGRTLGLCLRAAAPGGARSLTALGAGFLTSEVWVVALVGAVHGGRPHAWHDLLAVGALPLGVGAVGWVLRDAGLWFGPRLGSSWRVAVAGGAVVQVVGILGTLAALSVVVVRDGWDARPPEAPLADLVTTSAVVALVVVGLAQSVGWWTLGRSWRTPFFAWDVL